MNRQQTITMLMLSRLITICAVAATIVSPLLADSSIITARAAIAIPVSTLVTGLALSFITEAFGEF